MPDATYENPTGSQPTDTPPPTAPQPPLGLGIVTLLGLAGGLFILWFSILMLLPFLTLDPKSGKPVLDTVVAARVSIPAEVLAYGLLLWLIVALLRRRGAGPFWKALQWNWPKTRTAALLVMTGVALAIVVDALPIPVPPDLPITRMLRDRTTLVLFLLFAPTVAPFMEEIYFRGLLYPAFRVRMTVPLSILLTAGCFTLIHGMQLSFAPGPMAMIFLVGAALTGIRVWSGSVACSFLVHSAYNAALMIAAALAQAHAH